MSEQRKIAGAVHSIAWGYIWIHAGINVGNVDLLPDWIGYCLIFRALPWLAREVPSAKLLRPLGLILSVWYAAEWLTGILRVSASLYGLDMIITVVSLYFHFQLLTDVAGAGNRYGCPQGEELPGLRTARTVLMTVSALIIHWAEGSEWMLAVALIIGIVQLIIVFRLCQVLFGLEKALLK